MLLIPKRVRELINEGRKQERAEWEAWLKRLKEAGYDDLPTDVPPPSRRNGDSS